MVYLKNYNIEFLINYFKNKIDLKYKKYLEEVLNIMIKNNYRISKGNLTVYNNDGWQSKYSKLEDIKELLEYYKITKDLLLNELTPFICNNCDRLSRGYNAY